MQPALPSMELPPIYPMPATNHACRRHADKIAQLWSQRVKESPPNKKLTLVYLANGERYRLFQLLSLLTAPVEIVQQSKIRRKDEFLKAYDPLIAEGTSAAYKGSNPDIQNKIRRVVEVWRQRQVFRLPIQEEVERSLDGRCISSSYGPSADAHRNRSVALKPQARAWWLTLLQLLRTARAHVCRTPCHFPPESRPDRKTGHRNRKPRLREAHQPEQCNPDSTDARGRPRGARQEACGG